MAELQGVIIMAVSVRYASGQERENIRSVAPIISPFLNLQALDFFLRVIPLVLDTFFFNCFFARVFAWQAYYRFEFILIQFDPCK